MKNVSTDDWMRALESAAHELAEEGLGFSEGKVVPGHLELHEVPWGSLVALTAEDRSVQIGLVASDEHCPTLVRAFLQLEEDEELEDQDVADALGEMANVLAGGVKVRLEDGSLNLGLPVVLRGVRDMPKTAKTKVATTTMRWETAEAQLFLLQHDRRV